MANAKQTLTDLLAIAGVEINGSRPYDVKVNDDRMYARILGDRDLGVGESYMDGWWDVDRLDILIEKLMTADIRNKTRISPSLVKSIAAATISNHQSTRRAKSNAAEHYNIGNDLYEVMLDKRMIYSCAYWAKATNLEDAQLAKLDLICKKLHLQPGMSLLDIGCGWGGFAKYAAENYGVKVTGITPASEQVKLAKEKTKDLPVTIKELDYRDVSGKFDRIVSIGMLEHVGPKNYSIFFNKCQELLNENGLMLHHTIGNNYSVNTGNPWMSKYIFPGGALPSLSQITRLIEKKFIIEDVHSFGPYYDKTLLAWHENIVKGYPQIKDKYDERFFRMWNFYLLSCAAMFRTRNIQLWQIVMRRAELSEAYEAVR